MADGSGRAAARRRRLPGWLPWALLVAVVAVVAFGVWSAYQAYQVNEDLSAATDDVALLRTAVTEGDRSGIEEHLADLQEHSGAAADRTSGLTWKVLTAVPGFGDDARGLRVVSDVVHDLSTDGLEPALRASRDVDGLLPRDGRVDLDAVARLEQPVSTAAAALDDADRRLAEEDPSGYVGRLRTKYEDLQQQVSSADDALASASIAVDVLPTLLGADGAQQSLLVFENNAEVRATGGLPGAVSQIEADDGRLEITRQAAGSAIGSDRPVLPLTAEERLIYGPILGTVFVNANSTPDYPRAAALMRAHWTQDFGAEAEVDSVVSVDAVALSYVLAATGPIDVDGVTLTSDNVVEELLSTTYTRLEDPAAQDDFFNDVAKTAFERVTTGLDDSRALVEGLARAVDEGRLHVHAFDDGVQDELAGTGIAGELVTDPAAGPQMTVTLDDGTGAKMSYYLRSEVELDASCDNGRAVLSGSLVLTSTAPDDAGEQLPAYVTGGGDFGTPPGDQVVIARLYGPVGGEFGELTVDGREQRLVPTAQDGRSVQQPLVQLAPGQSVEVTWTASAPAGQDGAVELGVTPGIEPGTQSARLDPTC